MVPQSSDFQDMEVDDCRVHRAPTIEGRHKKVQSFLLRRWQWIPTKSFFGEGHCIYSAASSNFWVLFSNRLSIILIEVKSLGIHRSRSHEPPHPCEPPTISLSTTRSPPDAQPADSASFTSKPGRVTVRVASRRASWSAVNSRRRSTGYNARVRVDDEFGSVGGVWKKSRPW